MAEIQDIATGMRKAARPLAAARVLTTRLVSDLSEVEALWRAIEAEDHVSVHQTRAWCAAWRSLPGLQFAAVEVHLDGQPVGVFPLEIARKGPVRVARYIGTLHSNANSVLFAKSFLETVGPAEARELARALARSGLEADVIMLDKIRPQIGAHPHPLLHLAHVRSQNPSFQLPLHASFEATLAQINAKRRRKKFRVSERRLETYGGYRHQIAGTDEEARTLLREFFRQKTIRFKAQGLPDVFAAPEVRAAIETLACRGPGNAAPALELHCVVLCGSNAGRVIAIAGLTCKDGHVTCQFGSIDDTLATDTSAGELLFYRMIERACGMGADMFDFGVGDQPYKRSWCSVETPHADVFIPLSARGRLVAPLMAFSVRARRFIKTSDGLRRLANRIRVLAGRSNGPAAEAN